MEDNTNKDEKLSFESYSTNNSDTFENVSNASDETKATFEGGLSNLEPQNQTADKDNEIDYEAQISRVNRDSYGQNYNNGYYQYDVYRGYYNGGGYYPQLPKKKINKAPIIALCSLLALFVVLVSFGFGKLYFDYVLPVYEEIQGGENNGGSNQGEGSQGGEQEGGSPLQPESGASGNQSTSSSPDITNDSFDITQSETPGQRYPSLSDAYDATHKTVVAITVATDGGTGAGSGVIISKFDNGEGTFRYYIVTNNHVIEGANSISVQTYTGKEYSTHSTVLADSNTDLAIVVIDTADSLEVAKIGQSSDLRVGEDIYVIGNPLGTLGGTLTDGIISASAVNIFVADHYMQLLQTNAAINPGNSGGAMFNMSGELVGIVNAKYSDVSVEGIGFAIPIDTVVPVIEQMISQGYVTGRHNLGITFKYDTNYGISGIWLTGIYNYSSLKAAGFEASNGYYMLSKINGNTFTSEKQAIEYIDSLQAGEQITVEITEYTLRYTLREKAKTTYNVTLGQLQAGYTIS